MVVILVMVVTTPDPPTNSHIFRSVEKALGVLAYVVEAGRWFP
jgi:hypothetical protein